MKVNKYIFKIRRDTVTGYDITEVSPHFKNLKKKYAFENGKRFFRETLEGKIQFFGQNFELIYNSNINTKFTLIIEEEVSGKKREFFRGTFSKTDCKFDVSFKMCEPKISPIDSYSNIVDNYENEYELLEIPPVITPLYLYKRACIQVYIAGSSTVTNFVGGTYWEQDVNEIVSDAKELMEKYYFEPYGGISEVNITGVASGVNGVYAAVNPDGVSGKIRNENLYYLQYKKDDDKKGRYYLYNASNVAIYRSEPVTNIIKLEGEFWEPLFDSTTPFYIGNEINFYKWDSSNGTQSETVAFKPKYAMAHSIYQRLLCDVDSIEITSGNVKNTYDIPLEDIANNSNNYKKVIGLRSSNTIVATSRTSKQPTRFGINDNGDYFTSAFIPLSTGFSSPLPICRNSWSNASIWYIYSMAYDSIDTSTRKKYKLKDAFKLSDVIKALLSKIAPGISHEATEEYSKFLYGSPNPIVYDTFTLFITPKSNILKGEYDQAAQRATLSLKSIMDMLEQCFRCYWHIENGKFIIEHVSWYNNGRTYVTGGNQVVQYDLTTMTDPRNLKHVGYKQTEVSYVKQELASRYEFSWMDTVTDAFKGTSVDVKSTYVDKSLNEDVSVSNFTSDIDYMLLSPSDFSMDGFALMAAKKVGSNWELPFIKFELTSSDSGLLYSLNLQNGYLSWFYLIKFYMLDMPGDNISYSELTSLEVISVKACVSQEVKFSILNTIPDLYSVVKTDLGIGYISEMLIDLISKQAEVTILSKPK